MRAEVVEGVEGVATVVESVMAWCGIDKAKKKQDQHMSIYVYDMRYENEEGIWERRPDSTTPR